MLSYRHAFHAGNHADVLKHCIQIALLDYLGQKATPYWYIDTHAGAGAYALHEGYAAQNAEFQSGVARLWGREDTPPAVQHYLEVVRCINPDGELKFYPGSPWCAAEVMPSTDKLRLFELHPSDFSLLQQTFSQSGRRVQLQQGNGFEGIKSLLPPPPRRALVLIDPPYEDKGDYQQVVATLQDSLKRFATGIYALWYPCLQRPELAQMLQALPRLASKNWLRAELHVKAPAADGFGMHGSGLFILNAPWTLPQTLREVLPYLAQHLAQDETAHFVLEMGGDIA